VQAGVGPHERRIQIARYGSQLQKRAKVVFMSRRTLSTADAPKAIGPYAQGVVVAAGRFVFCSGQIAIDPKTGELVGAGDVSVQTKRVLDNLGAVLEAAGSAFDDVVKTTIYLADLQDFGAVNEVYARYFGQMLPARATIQAAGLPKGALVEIDAIAILGA
jgi:2-iminobutanoate/2-iminopropanoate deaminase